MGLAQWPTSWSHLISGLLTLTGRAVVVSLSILGPFLFPTFLLERDSAVVDQYLKGETMMVHQVKAATSELQLPGFWLGLQLAGAPSLSPS